MRLLHDVNTLDGALAEKLFKDFLDLLPSNIRKCPRDAQARLRHGGNGGNVV